jgi:hypothetical protein
MKVPLRPRLLLPRLLLPAGLLLAGVGCPRPIRPAPPEPVVRPAPPPVQIPAGCEADLSGTYAHAEDEGFLYVGHDDGRSLRLQMNQRLPDGGTSVPDGGPWIGLERTTEGFVGHTHAVAPTPDRQLCPVAFPTEVLACEGEAGLLLSAQSRIGLGEDCQPRPPKELQWRTHRLVPVRPEPEPEPEAEPEPEPEEPGKESIEVEAPFPTAGLRDESPDGGGAEGADRAD